MDKAYTYQEVINAFASGLKEGAYFVLDVAPYIFVVLVPIVVLWVYIDRKIHG